MLALLKKDFYVLRRTCLVYVGLLLFYIAFGAISGNFMMFEMMFLLLALMLPVTSMSYDERSNWNKYGMSLPVSRRLVVLSKYVFAGGAMVAGIAFGAAIVVVNAVLNHQALTAGTFSEPLFYACVGLFLTDISMPVMYQFGTEKGRYFMMLLIWGIVLVPIVLKKLFEVDLYQLVEQLIGGMDSGLLLVLFAAVAVLTMVSAAVSVAVFERKELS